MEEAEQEDSNSPDGNKNKRKALKSDFYKFQMKDMKKKQMEDLRKGFEEDRRRLAKAMLKNQQKEQKLQRQ